MRCSGLSPNTVFLFSPFCLSDLPAKTCSLCRFNNKWKTTSVVEAVVVTSTVTELVNLSFTAIFSLWFPDYLCGDHLPLPPPPPLHTCTTSPTITLETRSSTLALETRISTLALETRSNTLALETGGSSPTSGHTPALPGQVQRPSHP